MTAATTAAAAATPKQPTGRQTSADLAFYCRAMKAPALRMPAQPGPGSAP